MRRNLALLLMAFALVLAACGDDDSAATTAATSPTTTVASADDDMTDDSMTDDDMGDDSMSDDGMAGDDMGDDDMSDDDMAGGDDMTDGDMAEAVTFTVRVENVSGGTDVRRFVVFNTPTDADGPGPLLPGGSYEALVPAAPGEKISFATMFVQSNDWFVAPGDEGIALYDEDGEPISGDITDQLLLLDAGTEVDQTPGEGADQAPRQDGPDTGADDPDATIRVVDGFEVGDLLAVTVEPADPGFFTLTITNVSGDGDFATPFAPGVVAVHEGANPLFTLGESDTGEGLEALAEDGDPAPLAESLEANSSLPTPIAPVAAVAHHGPNPLFTAGTDTRAEGLEMLAEDGGPGVVVETVGGVAATMPEAASEARPAFPGEAYEFTIEASPGYRLSLATMFVQSNDWFLALDGVDLFDGDTPIEGDVTEHVTLWDAGTEADQVPGVGADQAPRQAGPDTGADDPDDTVRLIGPGDHIVEVTISTS